MNDQVTIRETFLTEEFKFFYENLDLRTQAKFDQVFEVIRTAYILSAKFVKKLQNSNLYEMRVSVGANEYRTILFAVDHDNVVQATKIYLLNGFLKKSTKDYKKQIKKAEKLINELEL